MSDGEIQLLDYLAEHYATMDSAHTLEFASKWLKEKKSPSGSKAFFEAEVPLFLEKLKAAEAEKKLLKAAEGGTPPPDTDKASQGVNNKPEKEKKKKKKSKKHHSDSESSSSDSSSDDSSAGEDEGEEKVVPVAKLLARPLKKDFATVRHVIERQISLKKGKTVIKLAKDLSYDIEQPPPFLAKLWRHGRHQEWRDSCKSYVKSGVVDGNKQALYRHLVKTVIVIDGGDDKLDDETEEEHLDFLTEVTETMLGIVGHKGDYRKLKPKFARKVQKLGTKKQPTSTKFTGKCRNCHQKGHKIATCTNPPKEEDEE